MSDTKALCEVVSAALDHHGNGKAQDAFEELVGRLRAAESMSECRSGKIGRLEEEVKTQFAMRQNSSEMCKALKAELDAEHARAQRAEADNAALLQRMAEASALIPRVSRGSLPVSFIAALDEVREDLTVTAKHPGAALLEEVEGLRKQVASLKESVELLRADRDAARDAALEEAAKVADREAKEWADSFEKWRGSDSDAADRCSMRELIATDIANGIRALKKTGQGNG